MARNLFFFPKSEAGSLRNQAAQTEILTGERLSPSLTHFLFLSSKAFTSCVVAL